MRSPGVEILHRLIAAYKNADIEATKRELHEDFSITEPEGLPYAGTYTGRDGWGLLMQRMFEAYSDLRAELRDVIEAPEGDRLVALYDMTVKMRVNGKSAQMTLAEVVYLRDGKILKILPYYFSTFLISEALKGAA